MSDIIKEYLVSVTTTNDKYPTATKIMLGNNEVWNLSQSVNNNVSDFSYDDKDLFPQDNDVQSTENIIKKRTNETGDVTHIKKNPNDDTDGDENIVYNPMFKGSGVKTKKRRVYVQNRKMDSMKNNRRVSMKNKRRVSMKNNRRVSMKNNRKFTPLQKPY